ncbi:MAG TPA: hypothetical protein VIU02_02620 [Burkholderiales bacterium]
MSAIEIQRHFHLAFLSFAFPLRLRASAVKSSRSIAEGYQSAYSNVLDACRQRADNGNSILYFPEVS